MEVIELIDSMRVICKRLAQQGNKTIRFVPTMGSLHAGHGSLIKRAKEDEDDDEFQEVTVKPTTGEDKQVARNNDERHEINSSGKKRIDIVIVSIFVNPIQFNQREDFLKYPQTLERDLELCQRLNVDYVFVPKAEDIYGDPLGAICLIKPPEMLANELEGSSRRGHFEGMLTIVCKLFNIITPNRAYFGEKDYQQLVLVKRMVKALNMDVKIIPVETKRDTDNLPLSSRNIRLDQRHRRKAVMMYDILMDTKRLVEQKFRLNLESCDLETAILSSMLATQCLVGVVDKSHHPEDDKQCEEIAFSVDYLELRCSQDLSSIKYSPQLGVYDCQEACVARQLKSSKEDQTLKARLLIAVIVGGVRLLDNVEVQLNLP